MGAAIPLQDIRLYDEVLFWKLTMLHELDRKKRGVLWGRASGMDVQEMATENRQLKITYVYCSVSCTTISWGTWAEMGTHRVGL